MLVELHRGPEVVATTAYGPWEEYVREYGRRLYGLTSVQVAPGWRGEGLGKLIVIEAMMAALDGAIQAAQAVDGPALVWFEIAEEQNVFPMMPAGKGLSDLIEKWGGADE